MASAKLISVLNKLVTHWDGQRIQVTPRSPVDIALSEAGKGITLPGDFKEYYCRVNGMFSHYYDNNMCEAGFLFYPLEELVTPLEVFGEGHALPYAGTVIFAEYLHKSWWYGVMSNGESGTYQIGIVPDRETFKPITDSLAVFIELYLRDDSLLYDYS